MPVGINQEAKRLFLTIIPKKLWKYLVNWNKDITFAPHLRTMDGNSTTKPMEGWVSG